MFCLLTFISDIYCKMNICSHSTPPERFLIRYMICTGQFKSFHAVFYTRSVKTRSSWQIATCANNIYNAGNVWRYIVLLGVRIHPSVIKMKQKSKLFPTGCLNCRRSPLRLRVFTQPRRRFNEASVWLSEWLNVVFFLSWAVYCRFAMWFWGKLLYPSHIVTGVERWDC